MNGCEPAFPIVVDDEFDSGYHSVVNANGLSILDWFAGMALQGIIAGPVDDVTHQEAAEEAFLYARAMIAEQEKGRYA